MSIYRKDVRHLDEIDLYVLADLYDVKSHAVFHAIKKLICAGKRGAKDYEQDLMEAIESIERELQMIPSVQLMSDEDFSDKTPEWNGIPSCFRFAVRDEEGKFVFSEDQPSSWPFWIRAEIAEFDEQRIDAIGQNGGEPHYDDCRMSVHWPSASPHHKFAYLDEVGRIIFSMHPPMQGEYISRPST